jgi:hypothetical protein
MRPDEIDEGLEYYGKLPPVRLPLGSDTVAAIEEKNRSVAEELAAWHEVALSTDF